MSELENAIKRIEEGSFALSKYQMTELLEWSGNLHATIIVDRDTQVILRATQGAEEMFGYEPDSLNNKPLEILLPDQIKKIHTSHVKDFNSNPSKRSMGRRGMELFGKRFNGTQFRVEISLLPRVFEGHPIVVANLVSLAKNEEI